MAVSKMTKIRVIGLKENKNVVLNFLQKKGVLEVLEVFNNNNKVDLKIKENNVSYDLVGVKFAISFLSKFSSEKISLRDKISDTKINIKEKDFSDFLNSYSYQNIVFRAQDIQTELNESTNQITEIEENISLLEPWKSLDSPIIQETKTSKFIFGIINENKYDALVQKLKKIKLSNIRTINKIDKNICVEIVVDKTNKEIDIILEQSGLDIKDLPCSDLSPEETISKLNLEIKFWKEKKEKLEQEARELSKEIKNLKIIFDILSAKKNQEDVNEKISETQKTFILTGWIEDIFLKDISSEIKNISNNTNIENIEVKTEEDRPVVIRNNSFWRPFEAVTGIYGLPRHYEIDPTPILAPFFILFFAFSLSDAGYGIILALLSFVAIKVLKVPKPAHNLIRLLGYAGLITFIIGALFGGWFGIDINLLPPIIRNLQLINPVENPILVLIISLILGTIHVISGLIVAFYWKIKSNKIKEAILDHGTWIAFLVSICLYVSVVTGILSRNYFNLVLFFLFFSLITVVYSQGRNQKNPLMKIISGVGGLYGLIGYFSDVLSYSRLLALGLATGIIAMVINMIAGIASGLIPYIGPILAIIILIFGHIFNIAINVLGSFIHSGRLQFVEFFPKFMEGGGKKFLPFKRELKYVDIID